MSILRSYRGSESVHSRSGSTNMLNKKQSQSCEAGHATRYDQGLLLLIFLLLVDSFTFGCVSTDILVFMVLLSLESLARLIAGLLVVGDPEPEDGEYSDDEASSGSDSEEEDECSKEKKKIQKRADKMRAMATPFKPRRQTEPSTLEKLSHMLDLLMGRCTDIYVGAAGSSSPH